uniref:Pol polyprotein n=1 Tax=Cajanus cajan TaxID=3821 RepID=A0A151SCE3_CAJCA|nr:Pol polyprotein [Cajanus cajan]
MAFLPVGNGQFPSAKDQLKFLLVAINYFTKWIEACPLAKITTEKVQKFTWKNIICRFGIPHTLVTDNGRQFIAQGFENFLRELGIKHLPTSVEHPQTNGQAEADPPVRGTKLLFGIYERCNAAILEPTDFLKQKRIQSGLLQCRRSFA